MSWQNSFVPESGLPQTAQQTWQHSFVPDNQSPQNGLSTGEEVFRQIGLAGRDIAGAVPMGIAGIGDLGNALTNFITGSHLDVRAPTDFVQNKLTETGLFPEYQNNIEKNVGEAASAVFTGGEGAYNLAKQAYSGGKNLIKNAMPASEVAEGGVITPKSSDIKLIKEKLGMAGITPEQYADALRKSSLDDFAGEVGGDPLRMQTQAQAKITGPAMQPARDAMRERMTTAPQRTAQIIGENIKPAENVQNMLSNIDDMKAQAGPLYEEAFKSTVPHDEFSGIIGTPSGQTALQKTIENFNNANRSAEQTGFSVDQNGKYSLNDDIPVETVHHIQRNIGIQVERDAFGNPTSSPGNQVLEQQQKAITAKLAELNPFYKKALNISAGYKQAEDAFSLGRQLAKSSAGETADAIMQKAKDVMSPNELSYQRAGYAQGLTDNSLGAQLGSGNPSSRISTGKVQNSAATILDSPTQAQKFADALMQEKGRIELAQRGLGGSNTAETLTAGIPEIPTTPQDAAMRAVGKFSDYIQKGKNERIARLLYATDPEQKALLAKRILEK